MIIGLCKHLPRGKLNILQYYCTLKLHYYYWWCQKIFRGSYSPVGVRLLSYCYSLMLPVFKQIVTTRAVPIYDRHGSPSPCGVDETITMGCVFSCSVVCSDSLLFYPMDCKSSSGISQVHRNFRRMLMIIISLETSMRDFELASKAIRDYLTWDRATEIQHYKGWNILAFSFSVPCPVHTMLGEHGHQRTRSCGELTFFLERTWGN